MTRSPQSIDLSPPAASLGVFGWMRQNLFSSPLNSALTLLSLYLIYLVIPPLVQWAIIDANIVGKTRKACTGGGACWVFVKVWLSQFLYGFFPIDQRWRIDLAFGILIVAIVPLFIPSVPRKFLIGAFILLVYPIIAFYLFVGGVFGLKIVETSQWGGLFLTLVISGVGIVLSLPLGTLLAMGRRQSELPAVRVLCILFIEVLRGVPLIIVLFMASVMFPLFLPAGVNFDKLLRALLGVAFFTSAEVAEVVRGGLQGIPSGQYEAADALGFGYWKRMGLIILPQAMKIVIPGLVNTFLGLFKDTTLVMIIGLFDLLGMVQTALTNPHWLGFSIEGYLFAAAGFWVFCFGMSRYSMHLERVLSTDRKS